MERANQRTSMTDTSSEPNQLEIEDTTLDRYRTAWRIFHEAFKVQVLKESGKAAVIDTQIQLPLEMFIAWSTGNANRMVELGMDIRKGLLLRGNVGSGKSILFRTLRTLLAHDEYRQFFRKMTFTTCESVAKQYKLGGDAFIEKYGNKAVKFEYGKPVLSNVCFDDLGTEEAKNHYGNYQEVMKDVITERYDHFVDYGLITCATTNLTMDEIQQRYDQRVRSRLEQMCNVVSIGSNKDTYKDRRIT